MNDFHKPVLLKEVLSFLNVREDHFYIDATLGGGGHTQEILKRGGKVLGIDTDEEAIDFNKRLKAKNKENLILARGNFKDIDKIARLNSFDKVSGIIFDLGVSSFQIDTPERGFSYLRDGPLDMRMDQNLSVRAKDLVNILTKGELNELISKLGEDYTAFTISERIVSARRVKKIETTEDLVEAIVGRRKATDFEKAKVARKVFQALRIAVNDELNNLREALPKAIELLERNGRVLVISFHSLEDRIVKNFFQESTMRNSGITLTKKPITAGDLERVQNPRSKSAKLRVFEKI